MGGSSELTYSGSGTKTICEAWPHPAMPMADIAGVSPSTFLLRQGKASPFFPK